ncbi:TetR/AcrR family transcriptional regulator [Actinomadura hibisca]|uniref:TetR/AcrR family transcriptional regulator n=1 Tax=Actinomadura hibisca TaxID=68565 RepID=UPI00082C6225|nr:TetR/AcrR family transcriptional regulator [Actinomadura hibisca]
MGQDVRRARQARSTETMDRFLDSAERLLRTRSFHDIGVMEIIEGAGRTVGSFYARFDDKYAVLRCLRERAEARVLATIDGWTVPPGATPAETVDTFVRLLLRAYREMGPVYRATAAQACVDDDFRAHRQEVFRLAAARYAETMLVHRARIGAPDPERSIDLGFTLMVGLLDQRLLFGRLGVTSADDGELAGELQHMALALLRID